MVKQLPKVRVTEEDRRAVHAAIRANMKSREGEPYSARLLDSDVKRIVKQGKFWLNARKVPVPDGVRLELTVTLRPVVKEVLFVDKHGKEIGASEDVLLEIITEQERHFSRYLLMHDCGVIEQFYRARGYPFANVEGKAEYCAEGVKVKFLVRKGHYIVVRSIDFEGNEFFDHDQLYARIQTRVQTFWRNIFIVPDAKYIRSVLDEDLKTLLAAYRDEGFLDAGVALKSVRFKDKQARVAITVDEGERYIVESILVKGNTVFSTEELVEKLAMKPGGPYRRDDREKDVDAISELYDRNGYLYTVEPDISYGLVGSKVRLTYTIHEGPQIYLEKLRIEGNYRTRDRVIRREMSVYPGEKLDRREWNKSLQRVLNLQYFEGLQVTDEPGSAPGRRTLVLKLTERKTGQMRFGFSYSTAIGLQGIFAVSQPNFDFRDLPKSVGDFFTGNAFVGGGTSLTLTFQPGRAHTNYGIVYRDPHVMDSDNRLSAGLHYRDSEYLRWDERKEGFHVGLGRNLNRKLTVDMFYRLEANTLTNISPSSPIDVFLSEGTKNLSALKPVVTFSNTDFDVHGTRYSGYYAQASYEYAGGFMGGEVDFSSASVRLATYRKVFEDAEGFKHVLSLELSGNWKEPHHNTKIIPWYERYFLGGPGTLRGFEWMGAGPKEGRDFIGGSVRAAATLEYSLPLPIDKKHFRGVLFVDTGNLARDVDSFLLSEFRLSVGFGLRIKAANMFVFVLDFGYPLIRFSGDERRTFHFSFGTEF